MVRKDEMLWMPTLKGSAFNWQTSKQDGNVLHTGVAFASCLGFKPPATRVWRDACDEGIRVMSHKTGVTKLFLLTGEIRANDEIVGWEFKEHGAPEGQRELRLTIYND